jgi:hypothetical protein
MLPSEFCGTVLYTVTVAERMFSKCGVRKATDDKEKEENFNDCKSVSDTRKPAKPQGEIDRERATNYYNTDSGT